MFLVAVGFWNFLGAGIFGFLINLPIVSYYEIGTALTANHAHAAMMGVYGMLAVGFSAVRVALPDPGGAVVATGWPRVCFWSLNIGLAWMVFVTLLPLGILQLYQSVDLGYFEARQLKFIDNPTNRLLEWLRLPGDVLFIVFGVLPLVWMSIQGVVHRGKHHEALSEQDLLLFTEVEVLEPDEATAAGALPPKPSGPAG